MSSYDPEVARREDKARYLRQKFGSVESEVATVFFNPSALDTNLMPVAEDYSSTVDMPRDLTRFPDRAPGN